MRPLAQRSPTFLAPGTCFVEDHYFPAHLLLRSLVPNMPGPVPVHSLEVGDPCSSIYIYTRRMSQTQDTWISAKLHTVSGDLLRNKTEQCEPHTTGRQTPSWLSKHTQQLSTWYQTSGRIPTVTHRTLLLTLSCFSLFMGCRSNKCVSNLHIKHEG